MLKIIVTIVLAVIGWIVGYLVKVNQDNRSKRKELRLEYLLAAYRRLEMSANRSDKSEQQKLDFESAIADIQLLGTSEQVETVETFCREQAETGISNIELVLNLLRQDLRSEVGLKQLESSFFSFRFKR